MTTKYLVFGGIGTLVESSRLQFDAFNKALRLNKIDFQWDTGSYMKSLSSSGGKKRLSAAIAGTTVSLSEEELSKIHADKTELYNNALIEQGVNLREGAEQLIAESSARGLQLIWATTTEQKNVDAIFDAVNTEFERELFTLITDRSYVSKQKPDPEIYLKVLDVLSADSQDLIVIEDSPSGVSSALAAGLTTLFFPGTMTKELESDSNLNKISSLASVWDYVN